MTPDEVRSTPQRRAVLDVIARADDHPTAAEVLERVCAALPGVGAATVYRTLGLLVDSGQIAELHLGESGAARYDRNIDHHDHLVCEVCGAVVDVQLDLDEQLLFKPTARKHGYTITNYDLRIHGVCADCRTAVRSTTRPIRSAHV